LTADHQKERREDEKGPVVYDPSAWTGGAADDVDPLTHKEFGQSRVMAAARVLLVGGFFCGGVYGTLQFCLHMFRKLFLSESLGDLVGLKLVVAVIGAVALLVCAFLGLRWLLRELILPAIRGGFTGKPCVFISDHGFIDTRIMRDLVPWEDVEAIRFRSDNPKVPASIVVVLNRSHWRRDAFLGRALRSRVVIWEGPLASELYQVLRAHFRQWRGKAAKARKAAREAQPTLSSPDRDPAALRRGSE